MSYEPSKLTTLGQMKSALQTVATKLNSKEEASNKVTSLSSTSTDAQYPSAKCVYDIIGDVESLLAAI